MKIVLARSSSQVRDGKVTLDESDRYSHDGGRHDTPGRLRMSWKNRSRRLRDAGRPHRDGAVRGTRDGPIRVGHLGGVPLRVHDRTEGRRADAARRRDRAVSPYRESARAALRENRPSPLRFWCKLVGHEWWLLFVPGVAVASEMPRACLRCCERELRSATEAEFDGALDRVRERLRMLAEHDAARGPWRWRSTGLPRRSRAR